MNETKGGDEEFLSAEDCAALAQSMEIKYRMALKGRKFSVSAEIRGRGVFVKVLLSNSDQSFYYPVEARILYEKEEMKAAEAAMFLVDYIDAYFEEFLLEDDEEIYLTIDWSDHQYEAVDFQMRGQIQNLKLEAMADEWLARAEPAASQEADPYEDDVAEVDEDEDEEGATIAQKPKSPTDTQNSGDAAT